MVGGREENKIDWLIDWHKEELNGMTKKLRGNKERLSFVVVKRV